MNSLHDSIYLSTAYLAPIEYYVQFVKNRPVFIEQYENYQKQSYRNRAYIMDAREIIALIVPVESNAKSKSAIRDIQISDHGNWQHLHWNALKSAYNSSPFFEYYADDFYPYYHKKYKYLFDFNEELRTMINQLINIDTVETNFTDKYITKCANKILDLREIIHPKKQLNAMQSGFETQTYYQVFSDKLGFTPNLSIVDLLFNMGNESILVLNKSLSTACV